MFSGRLLTSSGNMKKPSVPGPILSTPASVASAGRVAAQPIIVRARRKGNVARFGFISVLIIIVFWAQRRHAERPAL
jgi:hypothetical protein